MLKQLMQLAAGMLLVWYTPAFSIAQTPNQPVHAVGSVYTNRADSLRQDFILLRTLLNKYYPSLYRYNSKSRMETILDSCYNAINENTTAIDFYRMLKGLASDIKDGHLYVGPPPAIKRYFDDTAVFFPLKLQFINGRAYTLYAVPGIAAGAEILAINHQPVAGIRSALFKYMAGDGNITTKKDHILNAFFHIYYNMAYGNVPAFNVAMQTTHKPADTLTLQAVPLKQVPGIAGEEGGLLQFFFRKNNVAVLTIKSFDSTTLHEAGYNYRHFLDSVFTIINRHKASALIIDLRGNGGGTDLYGSLLYTYLTSHPFRYYNSLTAATRQLPYKQFAHSISSYNDLTPALLDSIAPGKYRLKPAAHTNLQLMQPAGKNYNGKVFILVDGLSFSTTAEFCAVAKSNNRAVFIGEETGGGYEGNTSGVQIDTVLPASKILFSFGTIEYSMDVRKSTIPGRGIIPGYSIQPTIYDIIHKRDVQMKYALQLAAHR